MSEKSLILCDTHDMHIATNEQKIKLKQYSNKQLAAATRVTATTYAFNPKLLIMIRFQKEFPIIELHLPYDHVDSCLVIVNFQNATISLNIQEIDIRHQAHRHLEGDLV